MTRTTPLALSILLSLALSTVASAFERPDLTAEEIIALERGEAIISVWKDREHKKKPTVSRGGIDIMASSDDVLAIMLDCGRALELSSDIRLCEVLETSGNGDWDIRKQKFAVSPVLPKFNSTFRTNYVTDENRNHVMEIERISGDLSVQDGRWDIIALSPTETRVIYQAAIKPKLPIPAKVIRKQVAIGIPDILRNLRDVSENDFIIRTSNAGTPKQGDM